MRKISLTFWILMAFIAGNLFLPPPGQAHPLDEFYQVTYIQMNPNRIILQVELYPAVLIAPQLLDLIDLDHDDHISHAEEQSYLNRFLEDITFEIDGQAMPLTIARQEFPSPLDIRGGVGVIYFDLYADLPADHRNEHQFFYRNNHMPDIGVYLVNALGDADRWVEITHQERDIFQSTLQADYFIKPDAPVAFGIEEKVSEDVELPNVPERRLTDYLYQEEFSFAFLTLVLGTSVILGGLHALTPGHGKTLVAAYLIGQRGTVGHAMALGGIVTFTHTASVIVIGLLALLASQFIVPDILTAWLEILSGLLVVYLGGRLLWDRWQAYRHGKGHSHSHDHDHHHDDDHHHIPDQIKLSDLLTLGISGGLVPCPEALGIMLIAIGLNRILLGLGMIVAFSFGLAAVLIIIGILLVRSRSLLDHLSGIGSRWQTLLPMGSAIVVTLLGIGIVIKGLLY